MIPPLALSPHAPRHKLGAACLLLLWCVLLLGYKVHRASDGLGAGMLWNLFLATIPLACSTGFCVASRRGWLTAQGICFCLWLLFLPNAPYILTDLVHLGPRPRVQTWYLLATLMSCAATGTLLGYLSLLDVHEVIERRFGALAGWGVAVGSLMACGFGIYVGRFLRWNSWDAIARPIRLLHSMAWQFVDSGDNPHPVPVTLVYGVGLIVGYVALCAITAPAGPDNKS